MLTKPNCTKSNEKEIKKIFLGGLPSNSKVEEISALLSSYAEILKIDFKHRTNKTKCLGHGILSTPEKGAKVLLKLGSFDYKGRTISLTPHLEGEELVKFREELTKRRFFIKNLPEDTVIENLIRYFGKYGEIETCYLRGEPSSSLKICVVIFKNKIPTLKAYEKYRFGEINFLKLLKKKKILKKIYVARYFSEFKMNDTDTLHKNKNNCERQNHRRRSSFLSYYNKKPGKIGYDYRTGNSLNYALITQSNIYLGYAYF